MATLKSRIEQLEEKQWQELMEAADRYLQGRSIEDVEFFCVQGYLPDVPILGCPLEISSWQRPTWKAHKRAFERRAVEEREFFCVHGYWPEQES